MSFDPSAHPHRRYDLLADRWLLVSPHRATRPWLGQEDAPDTEERPAYDAGCYLCPGNARSGGQVNPAYDGPHVFANDFPALLTDGPAPHANDALFRADGATGETRVICFSPDHARTLPELSEAEVLAVINCWCNEVADLGQHYANVQVFENKGAMMGCSNPHPHGQVWATNYVPHEVATEDRTQADWLAKEGAPMLLTLAEREAGGPRAVVETAHWIAIVPWWASWPYETLLLPRFKVARLPDLTSDQRQDLAIAVRELTARYDNMFQCAFPYSMGWHGAPFGADGEAHWQLHAHFYPPLLRSASVRKFMVGYEMLAEAQRDITPEQAAARLQAQSPVHYRAQS